MEKSIELLVFVGDRPVSTFTELDSTLTRIVEMTSVITGFFPSLLPYLFCLFLSSLAGDDVRGGRRL